MFIDLKRYFHSCHNECELINRAFRGLVKRDPLSLENIAKVSHVPNLKNTGHKHGLGNN